MIIDCHNHIGIRGRGPAEHQTPGMLLARMRTAGVSKAVVFPFDYNAEGTSYSKANRYIKRQCGLNRNLIGFGRLSLLSPSFRKEAEEIAGLGLKGIKIHTKECSVREKKSAVLGISDL